MLTVGFSSRYAGWGGRLPLVALLVCGALLLAPALLLLQVRAASGYASPLFQTQWQQGEAITPNFWGPIELAHDGQQEPYVEASGGQRLVQYFDKARMELTNPATNTVTNGLLATELITGNRQLGDNTFQAIGPATIPVAGDPDNAGPTYAMIQMNASQLLAASPSLVGTSANRTMTPTGTLSAFPNGSSFPQAAIGGYDATTQHNVPAAFQDFREKAGLLTIGLAISEPFWSNVKVGGVQKDVLIQAFERRVLTYTPTNEPAFQVEMGNIGQHYYQWRYVTNPDNAASTATATTTATTAATSAPTATPTSPATPTTTATTPMPAPVLTQPTISNITGTKATVTFMTDVASCGTAEVRVKGDTSFTTNIDTITCTPGTTVTVTLMGLNPSTAYEVRGAAKVGTAPIGYSAIVPFTTLTPQPTADSYEGTWITDGTSTTGIRRLLIAVTGNMLTIGVFDWCTTMTPDCPEFKGAVNFTGDPVSILLRTGPMNETLTITFTDDTRSHLKVMENRVDSGGTTSRTGMYTFHRLLGVEGKAPTGAVGSNPVVNP